MLSYYTQQSKFPEYGHEQPTLFKTFSHSSLDRIIELYLDPKRILVGSDHVLHSLTAVEFTQGSLKSLFHVLFFLVAPILTALLFRGHTKAA